YLYGLDFGVRAIAFSPDSRVIVSVGHTQKSGSWFGYLDLWEVATGQHLRRFEDHSDEVLTVAFAPDGQQIVSGSRNGELRVWEVTSGQFRCLEGHTASVTSVACSANGRYIISTSGDNVYGRREQS